MRILRCNIINFGCYSLKTFDFNSGLNSFCLNNGEGKTTLASFIKAMFYSLEKSSKTSYERKHYKPYLGGLYGGSIEIELGKKYYRIERTFEDSPTNDTLKIYDENGNMYNEILNTPLSSLQGESSKRLGELIFGIDVMSFEKCNFISSNDLDFSSSESIKMKIGNIVVNKDKENSYEDTVYSIKNFDLRAKSPTKKNENAYPYQISFLEKKISEKQNEIKELDKLEENLEKLYEDRNKILEEIKEIENDQKELSIINTKKGMLEVVRKYENDILNEENNINFIKEKYNYNLLTEDEVNCATKYIENYNSLTTKILELEISEQDIKRLNELEGNLISKNDYDILYDANSKINNLTCTNLILVDLEEFNNLKQKFDGKELNDEIDAIYYSYQTLVKQNDYRLDIRYPLEDEIKNIGNKICEYDKLNLKLQNFKQSYNKGLFIKFILIIITLGIYLIFLINKKNKYLHDVKNMETNLNNIKNELDALFRKYNIENGSYQEQYRILKNMASTAQTIETQKNDLLTYFSRFGYLNLDIDKIYSKYKKDLEAYKTISFDVKRNEETENKIKESEAVQLDLINEILNKYNLRKRDNFKAQLLNIEEDIEFYKKYNPIYLNKKEIDLKITDCINKIKTILNVHNICVDGDVIITINSAIKDFKKYKESNENRIKYIDEKNKYIKDNNLEAFAIIDGAKKEKDLQENHTKKSLELNNKEEEIRQNETNIARKDSLQDEILINMDLIEEYKEKIRIAEIALKSLEEAHSDMDFKYISPIKNSFISYAKRMYEKIGCNVVMNYDYEIKYDVSGQLHSTKDLSDGERTIMMLALRFAVLDSMYKNHDVPIVFDDPFDSLDEEKLNNAIDVIKKLAIDWQIIYFTCHKSRKI